MQQNRIWNALQLKGFKQKKLLKNVFTNQKDKTMKENNNHQQTTLLLTQSFECTSVSW